MNFIETNSFDFVKCYFYTNVWSFFFSNLNVKRGMKWTTQMVMIVQLSVLQLTIENLNTKIINLDSEIGII